MTTTDEPYEAQLLDARDRLATFAASCTDAEWEARVLGHEDGRAVGVIVDHVADAYGYLGGWISELVSGTSPTVSGDIVDRLNAAHEATAAGVRPPQAIDHLRRNGDALAELIRPLGTQQLALGDGRVQRLIEIAIRHGNDHRAAMESGLGRAGAPAAPD